jgi:diguanylate cyclase (GGDEF)-like protein
MRQFTAFASFKFKVTMLVTAMVLLAAVGVGGISLLITEHEMGRVIAQQELSVLGGAAAYLEGDLQNKQQVLRTLAEEALERGLGAGGVQHLLDNHPGLRDDFYNVTAYNPEGDLIANQNNPHAARINVSQRAYYRDTLAAREGVISAPFRSALSGKPVIAITQPLIDARGEIVAVLVAGIDLSRPGFGARMASLRQGQQGYMFITTGDGYLVLHPRQELLLTRPDPEQEAMFGAVQAGREGWRDDVADNGVASLVAWRRLHHVDWVVGVVYPLQSAFAPMSSVRLRSLAAATVFTALAGVFGWLLVKRLLAPLSELRRNVEAIDSGTADIKAFDTGNRDEFGILSQALFQLATHRQEAERDLQRQVTTDTLTGLHNRRMFEEFLPLALARAGRTQNRLALAYLDIDKFKAVNDTHGHAAGDAVLVEFGRRLREAVRTTDTVARLAGDEFVIVFEHLGEAGELHRLGAKILAAMEAPFSVAGRTLAVTASVGIAVAAQDTTPADLMVLADNALYSVKAAGRNGYTVDHAGAGHLARVTPLQRRQG